MAEHNTAANNLDFLAPDGSYQEKVLDYLSEVITNTGGAGGAISGIDTNNTSTTPLGIGGVYTGTWVDVSKYGEIKVALNTDVESASCFLQLSEDGVTVQTSLSLPPSLVAGAYRFIHSLNPSLGYFRVVYTNGAVAQTTFTLSTILLVTTGNGFVSRSTQIVDSNADVKLTRNLNDATFDRNFGLFNYQSAERKFGINEAVGNSAYEDVTWQGGNYPLLTTAETVRVRAGGDAADTLAGAGARTVLVSGLDENWLEATETINLNGASASTATTTTFIRINKMSITSVGTVNVANTGDITLEGSSSLSLLALVPAGRGNTKQAIVSIPAGKTAYVTAIKISVGQNNSADVRLWHTTNSATPYKHYEFSVEDFSGFMYEKLETFLKFEEKNTIGLDAKRITGSGSARVGVDFDYILIDN